MAVEDPQKDLFAFTQKSFWKLRVLAMDGHIGVLNCLLWAAS